MTTDAAGERRTPAPEEFSRWEAVWRQLPLLLGLVALWIFLWDHIDVLTVTTGILLAIAVTRLLYLPPVLLSGRFNVWRALLLGLRMMFDVVVASIQVATKAVWPTWQPMNAIIDVQLLTRSDLVTTLTAEAISVVPGTVVVDIDRERGLLYCHELGARDQADIDRARERILRTEERIVLAIGTRAQARAVHEARRRRRAGETGAMPTVPTGDVTPSQTAPRHPVAEHDAASETRDVDRDRGDAADRNGGMP
ncbi:Na+/H+ antiporter subunit E [Agromyces indicus]|uniref:Na+/H+ antiporter subunit E n=1 Tax=Agromyces indicus TaxID=758919 RepID=A0ABU1FM83_9MICO|nr:Na+/H+ antiporter subunit E [Agromyces indicus]MDR5692839.1 Na+/H+ antiporter subunit E [Agromyces indicus]